MKFAPTSVRWLFTLAGFVTVNLLAFLILLELCCWLAWSGYHLVSPSPIQPLISSPAYGGAPWLHDFYREESVRLKSHLVYVPFRLWGPAEWHGKYVNIDSSAAGIWRRSLSPSKEQCKNHPETSVWVFGSSAVFGTGVPDWETMPSYLSRSLNGGGSSCVVVTNFGMEGYVSTQEVILLTEQLKQGRHPSIVIFYEGFNDALLGMNASDPRTAHHYFDTIRDRVEGSFRGRFDFLGKSYSVRTARLIYAFFRRSPSYAVVDRTARAAATLDNYEANLALVRALSGAYNFKLYCFLEPTLLYGHKPLVPYEKQLDEFDSRSDRLNVRATAAVYEEAARRSGAGAAFVDLANLFDNISAPIYVDEVHVGPQGNELVANAIAKYMEDHPDGIEFPHSKGQ